jgi:hypothetical protein
MSEFAATGCLTCGNVMFGAACACLPDVLTVRGVCSYVRLWGEWLGVGGMRRQGV